MTQTIMKPFDEALEELLALYAGEDLDEQIQATELALVMLREQDDD